jgi:hypothetical protein
LDSVIFYEALQDGDCRIVTFVGFLVQPLKDAEQQARYVTTKARCNSREIDGITSLLNFEWSYFVVAGACMMRRCYGQSSCLPAAAGLAYVSQFFIVSMSSSQVLEQPVDALK